MTTTVINLCGQLMDSARREVAEHIEEEDGGKCFNLFGFLLSMAGRVSDVIDVDKSPTGAFELSCSDIARFLWCCLALESGDKPDGNTFRGMPILD